jgi:hypothetical protein
MQLLCLQPNHLVSEFASYSKKAVSISSPNKLLLLDTMIAPHQSQIKLKYQLCSNKEALDIQK